MKKYFSIFVSIMLVVSLLFSLTACGEKKEESNTVAKCYNGNFVGAYEEDTGVLSFKGIPYAKAPVGDLRWKAPVSPDASDETFDATEFGDSAIQYSWFSEPVTTDFSEDCLSLNVWTKDLETKDKTVMVFIHGGAFAWGGSSEPLYDGQYIVDEHPDVVVVTINYREGIMGFIDFSSVPGGEEFEDSKELGLLDCVEALKWVKNNIAAFGGNPDNVTIFGESAGGGIVSSLLAGDNAGVLFNRVIAESGALSFNYTEEQYAESPTTDILLELSGAKNMDDLMALSTEELIELNETPIDEDGTTVNDVYNLPLCGGKVTKLDKYQAVIDASNKGVDLLIGTNSDEQNYWIEEMAGKPVSDLTEEELEESLYLFENYYLGELYDQLSTLHEDEMAKVKEYLASIPEEGVWAKSKLFTERVYHQQAIRMAEEHSKGSAHTYMYLFEKRDTRNDYMGACHAAELPYVFHALKNTDYGTVDPELADDVCEAWVNFAKTGNPSSESFEWKEYDETDRLTTIIGDDGSFSIKSDPESLARKLLSFMSSKSFMTTGA